ncbi:MAG: hypothetical protein JKY63_07560 [Rhodobiaceae bacterium]|nr:hypothetical protein [Rhodobiaceae bacterium]
MNWLYWILEFVGEVAWPAAAVIIVFLLRREIRVLAERLNSLTVSGTVLSFGEAVDAVVNEAVALEVPDDGGVALLDENLMQLVRSNPDLAVLMSWRTLEGQLNALSERRGIGPKKVRSVHGLIRELKKNGVIAGITAELLQELSQLRNRAVHSVDHQITNAAALEFCLLAKRIGNSLEMSG